MPITTMSGSRRPPRFGIVVVVLVLGSIGVTGCSIVKTVKNVENAMAANRAIIDTFTNTIQSGAASTFEATYATTGSSPATIVYGVQPPKGLVFTETPTGAGVPALDIVANSSGEYSCVAPSAPGAPWSCQKLGATNAAAQNTVFDFYTPAHWVGFLKGLSLAAGIAGDTVTSSTMTVNGFTMKCVDFRAPGVPGTSTICTTAQGILGYVKVASDATSFEIKSYTTSPPSSLFQLPPGARVTTLQTPPTT